MVLRRTMPPDALREAASLAHEAGRMLSLEAHTRWRGTAGLLHCLSADIAWATVRLVSSNGCKCWCVPGAIIWRSSAQQERIRTFLLVDRSWRLPDAWGTTGRIWGIILIFQPTSGIASRQAANRRVSENGSRRANITALSIRGCQARPPGWCVAGPGSAPRSARAAYRNYLVRDDRNLYQGLRVVR